MNISELVKKEVFEELLQSMSKCDKCTNFNLKEPKGSVFVVIKSF